MKYKYVPAIPENAFNALPLIENGLQSFRLDAERKRCLEKERIEREAYFRALKSISASYEERTIKKYPKNLPLLRGPVVLYPYGGADAHHPFLTVPKTTDVFSQGIDSFGS